MGFGAEVRVDCVRDGEETVEGADTGTAARPLGVEDQKCVSGVPARKRSARSIPPSFIWVESRGITKMGTWDLNTFLRCHWIHVDVVFSVVWFSSQLVRA